MKDKTIYSLLQLTNAILLAGFIVFLTGCYYWVIKAGIPYQDPPPELQIKYAVNMGIGEALVKNGFITAVCGSIARLVVKICAKKHTQ